MDRPPPVVRQTDVAATVRDFGGREEIILRVTGYDVTGDHRTVDLDEDACWQLMDQLGRFLRQIHRGSDTITTSRP